MGLLIFPCVLASGESTLDCEGWSEASEPWLWWRGKPSASLTWSQRWKRDRWIRVLSTQTFIGSLGIITEAEWISSVEACRVNRFPPLVIAKPPQIPVTCGPSSSQGWLFSNLESAFLRTSMGLLPQDHTDTTQFSTMSSATWSKWVSEQQQDASQRASLGQLTNECDGSFWPTPTVAEGGKISNTANFGQTGLSNHPAIQGTPDRQPLNKSRGGLPDQNRSSARGRSQGQLNPDWVDQLMGFPVGWTDLEL